MPTYDIPIGTSVASVNSTIAAAVAGDNIRFERGGTWNGVITVSGRNGTSSNPITLTNYGTGDLPIINTRTRVPNSNVSGSWTEESTNKWSLALNSSPLTVDFRIWVDGVELPKQYGPSITSSRPVSHDTDYNKLYIYSTSNPATAFSLIEYPSHNTGTLAITSSSYIILDGLDVRGASGGTIDFVSSSFITIRNCNVGLDAGRNGIRCGTTGQNTDILIEDNVIDSGDRLQDVYWLQNGVSDGIAMYGGAHRWTIRRNVIKDWGHSCIEISNVYSGTDQTISDILVEDNELTAPDVDYCRGFALNSKEGRTCTNVVVTKNKVHDMTIMNQLSLPNLTFSYNLIYNITRSLNPAYSGSEWNAKGIFISGYSLMSPIDMKVYNNVIANCADAGIWVMGVTGYGYVNNIDLSNNIIYNTGNNTLFGYDNLQLIVTADAGTLGAVTIKNNLLFKPGVTDIYLDNLTGSNVWYTIAGLNGRNGSDGLTVSGNISADPVFTNLGANDFSLQDTSPALEAGLDLGTSYDDALLPSSTWPDGVETGLQVAPWNIGAYVLAPVVIPDPPGPAVFAMDFVIQTVKKLDSGDLPSYPDPSDPEDLGSPLTQDEVDTLKRFVKELKYRYTPET